METSPKIKMLHVHVHLAPAIQWDLLDPKFKQIAAARPTIMEMQKQLRATLALIMV
jgi:diadenosine tetraphosphate (Ap4A) HIT family hydrolase